MRKKRLLALFVFLWTIAGSRVFSQELVGERKDSDPFEVHADLLFIAGIVIDEERDKSTAFSNDRESVTDLALHVIGTVGTSYRFGRISTGVDYSSERSYPSDVYGWGRQERTSVNLTFPVYHSNWTLLHQVAKSRFDTAHFEERYWPDSESRLTSLNGHIPLTTNLGMRLSASHGSYEYEDVGSDVRDRTYLRYGSELIWQMKPSVRCIFMANFGEEDFDGENIRDREHYIYGSAIEYRNDRNFVARGSIGYEAETFSGGDQYSPYEPRSVWAGLYLQKMAGEHLLFSGELVHGTRGLDYTLSGDYRPNPTTGLRLTFSHGTSLSFASLYRYYERESIELEFRKILNDRFRTRANVDYAWAGYPDEVYVGEGYTTNEKDESLSFALSLDWFIRENLKLTCSYAQRKGFSGTTVWDSDHSMEFILSYVINQHFNIGAYYSLYSRDRILYKRGEQLAGFLLHMIW